MAVCMLFSGAGCDLVAEHEGTHETPPSWSGGQDGPAGGKEEGNGSSSGDGSADDTVDFTDTTTSEGLAYELNAEGTAFTVVGAGIFTGKNLVIPATHSEDGSGELPVTAVGENAFAERIDLTSVVIPASVTEFARNAFGTSWTADKGCTLLKAVNFLGTVADWCAITFGNAYANPVYYAHKLYLNGELLTSLTLPVDLQEVHDYAFYNCEYITGGLTIPQTVSRIGSMAFYGCKGFTGELIIPQSVTAIDSFAFARCSGFTSLQIPDRSSLSLKMYEFSECSGLTSVSLGAGLNTISQGMFRECAGLQTIVIPEGVQTIEQDFFGACPQLKSYTIPSTVTSFDIHILMLDEEHGPALTDIYYNGTEFEWNQIRRYNGRTDLDVEKELNDYVNEQCKEYLRFKGVDW